MDSWTRTVDLAFNLASLGYLVLLTGLTVSRWIRRGRVEGYSEADLVPRWPRRRTGRSGDEAVGRSDSGPGVLGWLLAASLLIGMIGWAIH